MSFARENLESGRTDSVASMVDDAEGFLRDVPDEDAAPLRAEIAAIRADLAGRMSAEDELAIRGARYKVKQVEGWLEMGYGADDIEAGLRSAEEFLVNVPDVHKAPVLAELAAFRARHAGGGTTTAVTQAPAAPSPVAEPTDDELSLVRRARTSLLWARENKDASKLEEAERLLAGVRDEHRAQFQAELGAIRELIDEAATAERIRGVTQFVEARLAEAERGDAASICYCFGRLASDELRGALPTAMMQGYQTRLAAAIDNRVVALRADALQRAEPHVRGIEERLVPDLFVGLDEAGTYAIIGECETLASRAEHELRAATTIAAAEVWAEERDPVSDEDKRALNARLVVPEDDPALAAVRGRLAAAAATIATALAAWRKVRLDAEVSNGWQLVRAEIDGWQDEAVQQNRSPLEPPNLPLTYLAVTRIRSLLAQPRTIELRERHAGDPAIDGVYQEAERDLRAALANGAAAFNQVLDELEQTELPSDEFRLDKLAGDRSAAADSLIREAERILAGSAHLEPYVARVRRLDERWQAEIAAMVQARQELYDRLSAEADAAWPGIVAATGATTGFDPTRTPIGAAVLLHQVYNRAGWEFNGCDFAMRWLDGTPVGGGYEDHVRQALEHAVYELKLDVNDRFRWDLIGVVEGPGKVGERTTRVLRDASTNLEIGKVEEWPPVECTWLRIVALHAGPVAVGPR